MTIDAAGYTKGLKLNGGTGDDTITGGAGADDMAGGLGNDVFVIGNADSGVTTATADIIRGFVTGTDKLDLAVAGSADLGTAGYLLAYDNIFGGVASVEEAVAVANGSFVGSSTTSYQFIYDSVGGTAGYLCADLNGDNLTDLVVQLAGVTSAIAFGDII